MVRWLKIALVATASAALVACGSDSGAADAPDDSGTLDADREDATSDGAPDDIAAEDVTGDDTVGEDAAAEDVAAEDAADARDEDASVDDVSGEDVSSGDTIEDDTGEEDAGTDTGEEDAGTDTGESSLIGVAAGAVCDALFRCCSTEDVATYFGAYDFDERLDELGDVFPPTQDACESTLAQAWTIAPFGAWTDALDAGSVSLDEAGLDACVSELRDASCGSAVWDALLDPTCFALAPPFGGESQRRMFVRDATLGESCTTLNDGVGGLYYGTCDPTEAFCCVRDGLDCLPPAGPGERGVCGDAASLGESCGLAPFQVCETGLVCGPGDVCEANVTSTLLSPGATCATESFVELGTCVGSYCDLLGTRLCEPRRAVGESCLLPDECISQQCTAGSCAVFSICLGE